MPQISLFPRVYVDLDDIVADTARAFTHVLYENFGIKAEYEAITSFNLGKSFSLTKSELAEFMRLAHQPSVLLSLAPVEGALETLRRWSACGVYIAIVTGRPIATFETSEQWLHLHNVPYNCLRFVRKYSSSQICISHRRYVGLRSLAGAEFALAIEDSPKMARFLAARLHIPVALFERPWNKRRIVSSKENSQWITRCQSWRQISDIFSLSRLHESIISAWPTP